MKMTLFSDRGKHLYTVEFLDTDLATARLDESDQVLMAECQAGGAVADLLLGLSLTARRIEEAATEITVGAGEDDLPVGYYLTNGLSWVVKTSGETAEAPEEKVERALIAAIRDGRVALRWRYTRLAEFTVSPAEDRGGDPKDA